MRVEVAVSSHRWLWLSHRTMLQHVSHLSQSHVLLLAFLVGVIDVVPRPILGGEDRHLGRICVELFPSGPLDEPVRQVGRLDVECSSWTGDVQLCVGFLARCPNPFHRFHGGAPEALHEEVRLRGVRDEALHLVDQAACRLIVHVVRPPGLIGPCDSFTWVDAHPARSCLVSL